MRPSRPLEEYPHGSTTRARSGCGCDVCVETERARWGRANFRRRHGERVRQARFLVPDESWRESAACAGKDPGLFFPEKRGDDKVARVICGACPSRGACLDWALAVNETLGIYGGLDYRERLAERKRRQRSVAS